MELTGFQPLRLADAKRRRGVELLLAPHLVPHLACEVLLEILPNRLGEAPLDQQTRCLALAETVDTSGSQPVGENVLAFGTHLFRVNGGRQDDPAGRDAFDLVTHACS